MKKAYTDLKVGKEFEVYEAKRSLVREWTRSIIAVVIVFSAICALLTSYLFGGKAGADLLKVWGLVSLPLGWVGGYYFRGSTSHAEKDN